MMLSADVVEPVRILGVSLGSFSSPAAAAASAFALGWLFGAIPIGGAELLVLAIAAVRPTPLIMPLVLVMTLGHVLGKLIWYWVGTQHVRVQRPWLRRQVDQAEVWLRRYPNLGLAVIASSALVSVPPFHLTAVGAGVVRANVWRFVVIAFVGRGVRFGGVALVPGAFEALFG